MPYAMTRNILLQFLLYFLGLLVWLCYNYQQHSHYVLYAQVIISWFLNYWEKKCYLVWESALGNVQGTQIETQKKFDEYLHSVSWFYHSNWKIIRCRNSRTLDEQVNYNIFKTQTLRALQNHTVWQNIFQKLVTPNKFDKF